jgi:lipopolysaccharide biosynthesis glycosyltransferase
MLHVACAADERYAPHCAAMLHSLLERHRPQDVTVHFLARPGFDAGMRDSLRAMVERAGSSFAVLTIEDAAVAGLMQQPSSLPEMWHRIFLPARLPQLERILYLDADVLVVDSLWPLWQTSLDGHCVAAVSNVLEPEVRDRPRRLGLDSEFDYFNSGVLLMNLAELRRTGVMDRVLQLARSRGREFIWPDQDPLNIELARCRLKLHPRWNCMNSVFHFPHARAVFGEATVAEAVANPAIVHFEGGELSKPWHYLCKHPWRAQYLRHRRQTPWPAVMVEGRSAGAFFLKPLPISLTIRLIKFGRRVRTALARRLARSGKLRP